MVDAGALGLATAVIIGPSFLSIACTAATLGVMWTSGAYRPRIYYRLWTHLPALLGQLTVAALLVSMWPDPHRMAVVDRLPLTVSVVIAARLVTYGLLQFVRARSAQPDTALIIGAERSGCVVADALNRNRGCGIRPIGFIDGPGARPESPLPVVSDLAHLDEAVARLRVKHLIVTTIDDRDSKVGTKLWNCQARDIEVWVVPPLFEFGADPCGRATDDVWAIPFQHLHRPGQHTAARVMKRVFDFAVAATMVLLTSPLLIAVALAVRLTSPGPIFFRQKRIGQHGRVIEVLKFRTMLVNSDSDTLWSVSNLGRMTPIGEFLRRSCVDELPQLFNVIRGDMSLVGPRPERPYFADHFSATVPTYTDRLRSPMGITGWAQIHGLRGDTSIAERTRFDNFYIEHWSMWLDVMIMVRTLSAIVVWLFARPTPPASDGEIRPDSLVRVPLAIPATTGGTQP